MDGLAVTVRVEVCEDTIIPKTSTLSIEPSIGVQSSSTLDVKVCIDESTHDDAFHVGGDQNIVESRENKNQTSLEEDVGHTILQEDSKDEGRDTPHGLHSLRNQLKVNEDGIMEAISYYDKMHKMIENQLWKV